MADYVEVKMSTLLGHQMIFHTKGLYLWFVGNQNQR
jgi:hypothetical protein